jgi:predicted nucleic acid-binding protein
MPTAAEHGRRRTDVPAPLVVDASAIVTLLIDPGSAGDAVAARMRHATLLAPALMPFEVANVVRRRRNAGMLSTAEADLAHAELVELPVELWPWQATALRAWELGADLSSYDAAYIALAEETDAPLLTRDARLASAPGVRARIELV